jgi:hypothetical protein
MHEPLPPPFRPLSVFGGCFRFPLRSDRQVYPCFGNCKQRGAIFNPDALRQIETVLGALSVVFCEHHPRSLLRP